MQYEQSSQHQRWTFSAQQLAKARDEILGNSLRALREAQARSRAAEAGGDAPGAVETGEDAELGIDAEDQRMLLRFYASKLQAICTELRLPLKVRGTAVAYLARYFLSCSVLDMHPGTIFLTCLYLACKTEESYISAGELGRLSGLRPELVLNTELPLLQGLKFDLAVTSPYRAVDGFLETIQERAQTPGAVEQALLGLQESTAQAARAAALAAVDALLLTDAGLMFSPGQLALCAVRAGLSKAGIKLQDPAALAFEGVNRGSAEQKLRLVAAMKEIDALGAAGAKPLDQARVAAIDKKVKAARARMPQAGKAQTGKSAAAKAAARAAAKEKRDELRFDDIPVPAKRAKSEEG